MAKMLHKPTTFRTIETRFGIYAVLKAKIRMIDMKKTCIALIGALALLSGCKKIDDPVVPLDQLTERRDFTLTRTDLDFIRANNGFAFDLFKRVVAKEDGKSTLISPLSVTVDFGMVDNGAVGATRDEINRVLGFEGSLEDFNAFCRSMLVLSAAVDPSTTLNIANAAVVNKSCVPLKSGFTKTIESVYDAEVIYKVFGKDDVMGLINSWCNEKTNGMIPRLLDSQPLPSEYAHFLNAVYFKGIWCSKFDKNDTKKESFTREDGNRTSVQMMWQRNKFNVGGIGDVCRTLCLPYGNQAYRMIILLPNEGKTIGDVKEALNAESWDAMVKKMGGNCEVDVKLPVFETETPVLSLREALIGMGIRNAFGLDGDADFSAMSDGSLCISDVIQKARIKVDETGSEAAAVTDIITGYFSAGPGNNEPQVIQFHCDHPFLYAITEVSSGAIYFIGQYTGK